MKRFFIVLILASIVLLGMYAFMREDLDRFNPFMSKEYVYVEINEEPKEDNGRYKYRLTGTNEEGQSIRVTFTTSSILEEGTYLKVLAKGAYTQSWELVDESEMITN
ncbi:YxeA family protein [Halalkalibacter sp. APA_J-10(15)]|uniref:YxeA family protein n=1 Tax=unclassified Halalkalibacter TaxID=2893063 RepID=UPI001FF23830|nr:YxeA family protein [Halalkalibacter sp. APA_J-10(15)]MCK0469990.1 YxeA family protein [Halalkalibacter sp. APA_J-10(15)]